MGSGNDKAKREAERTYELQRQQLELQRKQLEEMREKERRAEEERRLKLEELIRRKRVGRASTILTGDVSLGAPKISEKSLFA